MFFETGSVSKRKSRLSLHATDEGGSTEMDLYMSSLVTSELIVDLTTSVFDAIIVLDRSCIDHS